MQFSDKPQDLSSQDPQALAFELSSQPNLVEEASASEESQESSPTASAWPTTKTHRRGAWKLVRQRPADPLEVSESQNYQSVLNAFETIEKSHSTGNTQFKDQNSVEEVRDSSDEDVQDSIGKTQHFKDQETLEGVRETSDEDVKESSGVTEPNPEELSTSTKHPENFFDKIYEMFGVFDQAESNATTASLQDSTTVANPVFPEEITELPTTTNEAEQKAAETTETLPAASTQPYDVEPWEMKRVKTSTSTEVSHETEICYKGRCVKSRDKKTHK